MSLQNHQIMYREISYALYGAWPISHANMQSLAKVGISRVYLRVSLKKKKKGNKQSRSDMIERSDRLFLPPTFSPPFSLVFQIIDLLFPTRPWSPQLPSQTASNFQILLLQINLSGDISEGRLARKYFILRDIFLFI